MKCFVCGGVVTEVSLDEDGEEHLFECKKCNTKIVTTSRKNYYVVVEKLTSSNKEYEIHCVYPNCYATSHILGTLCDICDERRAVHGAGKIRRNGRSEIPGVE